MGGLELWVVRFGCVGCGSWLWELVVVGFLGVLEGG
jgi:hypothetical protein